MHGVAKERPVTAARPPRDANAEQDEQARLRPAWRVRFRDPPRPLGVPVSRTFSGPRLRHQRRLAGLSVHDVAARVGRSCWSIYAYERGQAVPPIPVADAIADTLGLPLDRFLADDRQAVA